MKFIANAYDKVVKNNGHLNLVVLHGLLGSKTNFKALCNNINISKYLQSVYLIDVRNHGDSPHTPTMTYEEMALDLAHFIEPIPNVVLLGHSMGGRIIYSYLQNQAIEKIKGVIIVDITPCAGEGKNYIKDLLQIKLDQQLNQIEKEIFAVVQRKEKTNLIMTNLQYADEQKTKFKWKVNMPVISDFMANGHDAFKSNYRGTVSVICGEKSEYQCVPEHSPSRYIRNSKCWALGAIRETARVYKDCEQISIINLMNQQQENLIAMDFSHIDNLDPCIEGGYQIVYNQELPFMVRFQDDSHEEERSTVETIRIRVMLLVMVYQFQGTVKQTQQITIELSSENDIFFYYFHTVDSENFQNIKNQQQLSIDFKGYPEVCIKTFKKCQGEQSQYSPVLTLSQNGRAKLQILQTLEYKEMEIISFDMIAADDEIIRQHVTYKYGAVKSRQQILNGKVKDIYELVKMKNPQLLLHLQKYMNY